VRQRGSREEHRIDKKTLEERQEERKREVLLENREKARTQQIKGETNVEMRQIWEKLSLLTLLPP
jgi:hypothetical protein